MFVRATRTSVRRKPLPGIPLGRAGLLAGAVAVPVVLTGTRPASATIFTPAQIRTAYGVSQLTQTGAGTTIAIVDFDNDATALSDANQFSSTYGLTQFNTGSGPTLTVLGQTGSSTLPSTAATGSTLNETSIDLQWAHAIAPGANILLVESNSAYSNDVVAAINTAKTYPGVSTVSMSFGTGEFSGETSRTASTATDNDATFQQTAGHQGVTFLAATGDSGTLGYPAASSYVMAVGGTSLTLNGSNQRTSETVWNDTSGSTGAGPSAYEAKPAYQTGLTATTTAGVTSTPATRIAPDVSWNADPQTGYNYVVSGTLDPGGTEEGGTSIAAPQWAGLIALADQTRIADGLDTLTTTQALQAMYNLLNSSLYSKEFYDVTSGSSNGYSAETGYDAASGLGSPEANNLVLYLAGVPEPTSLVLLTVAVLPGLGRRRRRLTCGTG